MTKARARKAGRKRKQEVTVPPLWDHGATGPANRIGLVIETRGDLDPATGKQINPNGVTGARRRDLLEFWHRRGTISTEGWNAAEKLRDAYEATHRGPAALPDNDRVQSSPKPDQAITIMIDRISDFTALMKLVASEDREIISRCVLDGAHPGRLPQYRGERYRLGFDHLRAALDRLAQRIARPRERCDKFTIGE